MTVKTKRRTTLMEREMAKSPERAARIRARANLFTLESQIQHAMEQQHVSASELAERLDMDKGMLSRDLNGGLSKAKYQRIERLVEELGYEIIPLVVPVKSPTRRQQALKDAFTALMRQSSNNERVKR